jgi:hypothetical protein
VRVLEQTPRRETGELLVELRTEERGRIRVPALGIARCGEMRQPLGDDQLGFFRRAAFKKRDRTGLLDAVDVRLREHAAHLAVEVFQARDDENGVRHPVGDLDEIAHGALESFLGVGEKAQVLDLIDAEYERGALDGPHQRAEGGDDLEGAVFAAVRVECGDGLMRKLGERAPVQVLADALVDARIAALQVEHGAHDVDVEVLLGVLGAGDDIVGNLEHELGELGFVEARFAQVLQVLGVDGGVDDEAAGEARQSALAR